jgi:hypothetical protein
MKHITRCEMRMEPGVEDFLKQHAAQDEFRITVDLVRE